MCPSGINTIPRSLALAEYAAIEAEVLPVDAQATALTPSLQAWVTLVVIP